MIDDPQDVATAFTDLTNTLSNSQHSPLRDSDPRLDAFLRDINDQVDRIRRDWPTWDIEIRHDAVNELHCRTQEANVVLLDAVRLSDFEQAHS